MREAGDSLDRARSIHGLVSSEAREGERLGRLTDKAARAMLDQGLFSLLLPSSAGGLAASIPEYFDAVEEVASADGSAAWCLSICAAANLMFFRGAPEQGRQEIFGNGPVAMWTGLLPRATSAPAQGGFLVSGKFGWGSGSSLGQWALITESLPDRDGLQWFRSYAVAKADVVMVPDSWQVMGLKATASVDYEIAGAFVPAHRCFEYPLMDTTGSARISTLDSTAFHQVGMAAFASGVARKAILELASTAGTVRRFKALTSQAEDEAVQQALGETQARLAAARGHYLALLAEQDSHFQQHGRTSREVAVQCIYAANVLARAARETTLFAFDNAATAAMRLDDPLQRCLRDLFAGLKHPTFSAIHLRGLGKDTLGIEQPVLRL